MRLRGITTVNIVMNVYHSIRTYTWKTTFVGELYSGMRLVNMSGKFESGLFSRLKEHT